MRINGFEQIKAFYSWVFDNQDKNIKPQHISLYLFLLNQNNRANWIEWFKCPYDLAMTGSSIGSKSTYYNCLQDLQEWKIIKYKPGVNNWKAPVIKLEVLKCTSTVPQSEPQPIPLPIHIYKLITDNLDIVEKNLEKWINSEKGSKYDKETVREKIVTWATDEDLNIDKVNHKFNTAWAYYEELGWVDKKGNEVKSPYMKIRTVWFKDLKDFQDDIPEGFTQEAWDNHKAFIKRNQ